MGFWKDVYTDMQCGVSKETAIRINAELRYGNHTPEEKTKLNAELQAESKLNSMP